ncbi:SprT family protein [Virgibacillus dakarensis]|uniref:Protein SprT-like n=1 Tax=Lentibacillus populi TaxID=1827502 RepID=A0A9W5U0X7_9BACI|nr:MULTISPECIES: SprT family protein [Bacillaceae]MBT2218577.1 SprT family protein [Virgibacillus dakarensis]MTW88300.1 SprT family protein [Virgibacillus dakarensis]GGB55447.1 protein SprT [Lentibacillus populi]
MNVLNKKELYNLVNNLSIEFFHKPFTDHVQFNSRLRTTGGRYIPVKKTIELNPKYLIELDMDEFIGIIKHELCHYHLHIEGKGYKHGDESFKRLLKETGSPRHCNPLPSSKRAFKYLYECQECGHVYRRLRKMDVNKYRCGKCRGKLLEEKLK